MLLELINITKKVGHETHLYEMSLELNSGLNVLLGKTLAGKTSLMRIMAGLDRPTKGKIILDSKDITKLPVQKRNVAFVYQQFINYPNLTVFENIASPLRLLRKYSKEEIRAKVNETAEMMQISNLLNRLPAELSGGQQQRTAISRALVKEADLLIMDEPLVNLDYKLREELRLEMKSIFEKRDSIVVYASTEPLDALLLAGQTIVIDEGKILQNGPTIDVYNHPLSQRVGQVFSDPPMNIIEVQIENGQAILAVDLSFKLPDYMSNLKNGKYQLGVRAHHINLKPFDHDSIAITGNVELAEISGSETFVHLSHKELDKDIKLVSQLEGVHSFDYGQDVTFYLNSHRLYMFEIGGKLAAAPIREKLGG